MEKVKPYDIVRISRMMISVLFLYGLLSMSIVINILF